MLTRLFGSPVVKGFLGAVLGVLLCGLVYRMYQTDQMVRQMLVYLNAQAQSRPK